MLNLFTGFTNYVRHGDQAEKKLKEIRIDIEKIRDENRSMRNEREKIHEQVVKFKEESIPLLKEMKKEHEAQKKQRKEFQEKLNIIKLLPKEDKQLIRKKIMEKKKNVL